MCSCACPASGPSPCVTVMSVASLHRGRRCHVVRSDGVHFSFNLVAFLSLPSSTFFMSQSSQSDAFVDLATCLSYKADRKAIVSRLEYLPSIQDADAACEWVMEAGATVVRSIFSLLFLFVRRLLGSS